MKRVIELVLTTLVVVLALYGSYRILSGMADTDHWIQADARFVDGRVEQDVTWDGEGTVTNVGQYVVHVTYEYVDPFDQVKKRSQNVLAGGRVSFLGLIQVQVPLTLGKDAAESLVYDLRIQEVFPVYINPADPSDTGIVRARDVIPGYSRKKMWGVGLLLLVMVGAVAFGGYWLIRHPPERLALYRDELMRWLDR